jgi:hypothetical protein
MKGLNEVDGKGIKISERLRANVYPDSDEKLKEDLIATPAEREDDEAAADSQNPDNQEWQAREKAQKNKTHH